METTEPAVDLFFVLFRKVVELLQLLNRMLPGLCCAHDAVCLYNRHLTHRAAGCLLPLLLVLLLGLLAEGLHVHWSLCRA